MTNHTEPVLPTTLFEFIGENIHRAKSRGSTRQRRAASSNDLPLIDEDGLRFRIVLSAQDRGTRPAAGHTVSDPGAMAFTFRKAFADTWNRIPEVDRRRMLAYWRRGPTPSGRDEETGSQRWPLIQIVNDGRYYSPPLYTDRAGHVMTFPAWFVATQTPCLPRAIARLLAQVCRAASGQHWREVMRMIEEPLARWQRKQGDLATQEQVERKVLALEAAYVKVYESRIVRIVLNWGLGNT